MDFSLSPRAQEVRDAVRAFVHDRILPVEAQVMADLRRPRAGLRFALHPQIEAWKEEARGLGLWNLFDPHTSRMTVVDYASVAEEMGHSLLAPEVFNCNAPDTGNMEVLQKFGSAEQKARWLTPLLEGRVRSAFCMTEPAVASSDATNMRATIRLEGDEIVIDGRKWWSTGVGHPNCRVSIVMGLTHQDGPRHASHSMALVPLDSPGVRVERLLSVFGDEEPPFGHGEVVFDQVRLPRSALIGTPGAGFAIAQSRLGPGRIHHCMRCIGAAERALALACQRAWSRTAFGRPLARLDGNRGWIGEARVAIAQARLLTLHTAWLIDRVGAKAARSEISQIKLVAPRMAGEVIDQAIQLHGAAGLHHDLPLAGLYALVRTLRLADGPDEVHRSVVGKTELARHAPAS